MAWLKLTATEFGVVTSLLPAWLDEETLRSLGGVVEDSEEHVALKAHLKEVVKTQWGRPKKIERHRSKCR